MVAPAQSVWGCCRKSTGCDMATTCIAQSEMASCAMDAYCVTDDFATKWYALRTLLQCASTTDSV
jgi:hypothetical protein